MTGALVVIAIVVLTLVGAGLFVVLRMRAWSRFVAGQDVKANVAWKLLSYRPLLLNEMEAASQAIDEGLRTLDARWAEKYTLVVEWHPYGAVLTGPYSATGFQTSGGVAVSKPSEADRLGPNREAVSKAVDRVVGTIRPVRRWPWSKPVWVVMVMDRRVGETSTQVLFGEDPGRGQAGLEKTALFYEVAQRFVPLAMDEVDAATLSAKGSGLALQELGRAMRARYLDLVGPHGGPTGRMAA